MRADRQKRWWFVSLIVMATVVSLVGCGRSDPYAAGADQFTSEIPWMDTSHANSGWTVYVAPGTVETGWLWFKKATPVLYVEVDHTMNQTIADVVIKVGDKTVKSPLEGGAGGLGFHLQTARLPGPVDISWKVDGKSRHVTIKPTSIVVLPWVDGV